MVAVKAKNTGTKIYTVTDAVCPVCLELLTVPSFLPVDMARYIPDLRRYFGWCFTCNRGFCVIQFKRQTRWVIHKYQVYIQCGAEKTKHKPLGQEVILNELPDPPVVLFGPGGDFDTEMQIKATNIARTACDAIAKATEALRTLLNPAGEDGE